MPKQDAEVLAARLEDDPDYRVLRRLDVAREWPAVTGRGVGFAVVLDTETTGMDPAADKVIELALVKHFRVTGDRRSLNLARYFVDERGAAPHYFDQEAQARGEDPGAFTQKTHEYSQSHLPVRQQTKVVGHAVRAMYLYSAMADLAVLTGDASLARACETLWGDLLLTKMYVTGGIGPSASNEGFTRDYDLPNATAYAETCAAVALIFWAQRMLHLGLDGRYADILETALDNGALVGLSRDGTRYFYANPLESDGTATRWHWHDCPCCTMNVSRLIASVAGYFLSTGPDGIAVHLYGGFSSDVTVGETHIRIDEDSRYPWDGAVRLTIAPERPARFALRLRIPGWASSASATVNGAPLDVSALTDRGYLIIDRLWHCGYAVTLDLPMPPERLFAHPEVTADTGRTALRRGPLVYCVEDADNTVPVRTHRLPPDAPLHAVQADLFGGIVALTATGRVPGPGPVPLYAVTRPRLSKATVTAIPYYLWNNRGQGGMSVWIAER